MLTATNAVALAFSCALLSLGGNQTTKLESSVIDLCEVLPQLDHFDGKTIAVRGYYRFSRELGGLYVANCANPIMIDGVQRAAAVYVLPRAKSQEGIAEEEEFAKAVKSLIKSGRPDAISVVFLGRLRASAGPSIVDSIGNKRKPARMFGHLGVYPAEMEVERTLDIKILNDPNHAANMSNLKP